MFAIAYRMLGEATEADDIVQEAYLKYRQVPEAEITSPKAFLSTIVTRLCLNHLRSAKMRRETYVGTWLPEPILTEEAQKESPARQAELHESLSVAFLSLLEQLSPLERAVFLLRKVFDYEYDEIAAILGKNKESCRKTFSRARKYVFERRPRFQPDPEKHRKILEHFLKAVRTGRLEPLQRLLTEDVVLLADGGGKVRGAVRQPLRGSEIVARFVLDVSTRFAPVGHSVDVADMNGEPALVAHAGGTISGVIFFSIHQGRISEIRAIGNPDKLRGIDPGRLGRTT